MRDTICFLATSKSKTWGVLAACAIALTMPVSFAVADGAIAVGSSGDLAKDGFAFGASLNQPDRRSAREEAVAICRRYVGAPKMAELCRPVASFRNECYALAFDSQAGMPGTGWAIGRDKAQAERRALGSCRATAGKDRAQFCVVHRSDCDGTAN